MKNISSQKGFTLIELMTVIGIFAFLSVMASVSYSLIAKNIALKNISLEIGNALRLAQNRSMASFGGVGHGVYFLADRYVTYDGNSWTGAVNKVECLLDSGASIDTSDPGFRADLNFERLSGSSNGTTIKLSVAGEGLKTITVNGTGKISSD